MSKIRTIVLGSGKRPGVLETFERLRPEIERYLELLVIDFTEMTDSDETEIGKGEVEAIRLENVQAEMVLVLGGDGAILNAAHRMNRRQLPVLAVNLGSLGFLAGIRADRLIEVLECLNPDNFPLVRHLMLECQIWREKTQCVERHQLCLNEIAAFRGDGSYRIANISLLVDHLPVTTFRCDGLIISTPVGSTAHNLAGGGPILRKDLDAVVITPIGPHSLNHRPVVDSADRVYELTGVGHSVQIVLDGERFAVLEPGDRAMICRGNVSFLMIEPNVQEYYTTLRNKLGWGELRLEVG